MTGCLSYSDAVPPHVGVQVALPDELVSSQVGVVRRGDEVAAERPIHVLVHGGVSLVKDAAVFGLHVPEEAPECHGPILPGWRRWKGGWWKRWRGRKRRRSRRCQSTFKEELYNIFTVITELMRVKLCITRRKL